MSRVNTNICRLEDNTGLLDLHQVLQQILPDRVQRLVVAEHELLQMQVQLGEVRKENVIIKRSNIQLVGNLEDAETRLASTGSGDSTGFTSVRGPESVTLGNNDAAPRGAAPHTAWGRDRSTEKDDRLRRASQLFSHPQLTQEFARQKVSTTQNKADKSIYGDVLESVSLLQQKLGLEQTLNVSDFPELKEADQRKSLDLFTATWKDMAKADELTVEKAKAFVNIQAAFSKAISSTHHQHRNYLCDQEMMECYYQHH